MPQVTDFIDETPSKVDVTPKVSEEQEAGSKGHQRRPWQDESPEILEYLTHLWEQPETLKEQPYVREYVPERLQELGVVVLKTAKQAEQRLITDSQRQNIFRFLQRLAKFTNFS